jgi:hypothetical protein
MLDCNNKSTPLPLGIVLSKDQSPKSQEDHIFMADKPYREVLGLIMYTQIGTRPDLFYAILTLSKYAFNPGIAHWQALMHILRYIKATLNYKITCRENGLMNLRPIGWVDANYGGDIDSRQLCTGYVLI